MIQFNRATIRNIAAFVFGCVCELIGSTPSSLADSTQKPNTKKTVVFLQPNEAGLGHLLLVPPATHVPPAVGEFHLVLWEPNPNEKDGQLVPTTWQAGSKTGFYPSPPVQLKQAGYRSDGETTTAQMDGDTVGAYLKSDELPASTHKTKLMIAPSYRFPADREARPFSTTTSELGASLELQVPTANDGHIAGSETYIVAEFLFRGSNGKDISYGVPLFFNGVPHSRVTTGFDSDTQSLMFNSPLGEANAFVRPLGNSQLKASLPWRGWRQFAFAIGSEDFSRALNYLNSQYPQSGLSLDPANYRLVQIHLNAELHFGKGPAELGWSMRKLKVEF